MKQLGIKDKDILFKAAQTVHNQPLFPQRSAVELMEAKPVGQQSSEGKAPPAPPMPSKQPLAQPSMQTIINVSGDYIVNQQHPADRPREIPFDMTEEGQRVLEKYVREFRANPPDDLDLKAWARSRMVN